MITPIVVPVNMGSVSTCPEGGKQEKTIAVCKHCGYDYPKDSEPIGFWGWVIGLSVFVFIIWAFGTIIWWLVEQDTFMNEKAPSLWEVIKSQWEVIKSQWEFIKNLKIV